MKLPMTEELSNAAELISTQDNQLNELRLQRAWLLGACLTMLTMICL